MLTQVRVILGGSSTRPCAADFSMPGFHLLLDMYSLRRPCLATRGCSGLFTLLRAQEHQAGVVHCLCLHCSCWAHLQPRWHGHECATICTPFPLLQTHSRCWVRTHALGCTVAMLFLLRRGAPTSLMVPTATAQNQVCCVKWLLVTVPQNECHHGLFARSTACPPRESTKPALPLCPPPPAGVCACVHNTCNNPTNAQATCRSTGARKTSAHSFSSTMT
jgi:hypothetical protein